MTRSAEFRKGVADRQHRQAQGIKSRSGDDEPTPSETAAMLEGFGVSQYPPGESFRAQLNQSTPRTLPGSALTSTRTGPEPSEGVRPAPNWSGVNAQRQALQESIAGGAVSSGLGVAPTPNDANTLAQMAGPRRHPSSDDDGGGFWSNLQHDISSGLGFPQIGGAVQAVGRAVGSAEDLAARAARGQVNIDPETAERINNDVQIPANLGSAAPDRNPMIQGAEGATWADAGQYIVDASGIPDLYEMGKAGMSDPLGAMHNIGHAGQWAVTHPKQLWKGTQRVVPAVFQHYKDNPGEIGKLALGAAMGAVATAGVGTVAGAGINFVRGSVEAAEVSEAAAQVGRSVLTEGAEVAANLTDDAARVATSGVDDVARVAASNVDEATSAGTATAREAVEEAARPQWGDAVAEAAAQPQRSIGQRVLRGINKGIDISDEYMGKYVGAREDLRNWAHNLPRRAVGMEEKDLRLSIVGRQRERIAERVAGGEGAEGSTSATRQLTASRIAPARREMPELPEDVGNFTRHSVENQWRRSVADDLVPDTHVSDVQRAISIADDPKGWLMDKLDFGDGIKPPAEEAVSESTPAMFRPTSSRPKSTAKRRMPQLSQPDQGELIPQVKPRSTDEPMYGAENAVPEAKDWYDKKLDELDWGEELPAPTEMAPPTGAPAGGGGGGPTSTPATTPAAAGGGGTPTGTGGGSGNPQTQQYSMGRGFHFQQQARGPRKSRGFWEGRPEFTGAASNYDRLTIRPITVPRGPSGPTKLDLALAAGAGAMWRRYRGGGRGGAEQSGGVVEQGEPAKDPFGDPYETPMSREEGMAPSAEAQRKADEQAAWAPPF